MITIDKLKKFNYLSDPEVKDIWYKPENKEFEKLRNAINCIGGLISDRPIWNPYNICTNGMQVMISVDEFKISPAMKILTRALDNRYGGSSDWECKMIHTDQEPYFKMNLDTGFGIKCLNQIVEESDRVSENIMRTIDDISTIDMFESTWLKRSDDSSYWGYDYGHINSEMFEIIERTQNRMNKLTQLGI
jgi:hypothetical protein